MNKLCNGKIKLPKRLVKEGVEDGCHTIATKLCQNCGKHFCHNHIKKHACYDDLPKVSKTKARQVVKELAEMDNEKEIAKKFNLTIEQVQEIMTDAGYLSCPNCSRYVESGEMLHNPEDDSDYACDACAGNWGWE
jgi:hypothetical protein